MINIETAKLSLTIPELMNTIPVEGSIKVIFPPEMTDRPSMALIRVVRMNL
jgi:hypothetical protein